jgi:hypothetical protein
VILGSGVVGLVARHIFGSGYKIIPYGNSRFFQYNPAPSDNFIRYSKEHTEISGIINSLGIDTNKYDYNCAWSVGGSIVRDYDPMLSQKWISKININMSHHIQLLYKDRMNFQVYGTRVTDLYNNLKSKYDSSYHNKGVGDIYSISDHVIRFRDGTAIEYDKCISTIPLDKLYEILGINRTLLSSDVTAVLLESDSINMEGYNQLFVVDDQIPFFKVTQVKPNTYVFYFVGRVEKPSLSIGLCVDNFDLISGIHIEKCIPAGELSNHSDLRDDGILPIGASAQWDHGMDMSSCVYKLLKMSTNDQFF